MKSSSSVPATPWAGVVDGAFFARWALADLSGESAGPIGSIVREDEEEREDPEAAARAEAEARARAEAEAARREKEAREAERRAAEEQEARVREAYEQGYEEGRHEGEIAEGARLRTAVKAAEEALDEIRDSEVRWTGAIEENICALAVAIARHVIGRELKGDVEPVLRLVRDALAEFPIDQPIRVRLSPQDLLAVRQLAGSEDPMASLAKDRDARWVADSQVAPGGCVVEGRERIVDGRVDTALERIYRRLTYTNA